MSEPVLVAIEFAPYGSNAIGAVSVKCADVEAFIDEHTDANGTALRVTGAYAMHNGKPFWTSAKCWWSTNTGRIQRIGAGAYGDWTVWKSSRPADHKAVWR